MKIDGSPKTYNVTAELECSEEDLDLIEMDKVMEALKPIIKYVIETEIKLIFEVEMNKQEESKIIQINQEV